MADNAIDNDPGTIACTHHTHSKQPWWAVDLGKPVDVSHVSITNDRHTAYGQLCDDTVTV